MDLEKLGLGLELADRTCAVEGCGLAAFGPPGQLCDRCIGIARDLELLARFEEAQAPMIESIPPKYRWATSNAKGFEVRVGLIGMVHALEAGAAVVLFGDSGAGKTTLACVLLRLTAGAIQNRHRGSTEGKMREAATCRFARATDLIEARYQLGMGRGECEAMRAATAARVLVLDDLGLEPTPGPMADLIYRRADAGRGTIITTALKLPQLEERYGEGVVRRIASHHAPVALTGRS